MLARLEVRARRVEAPRALSRGAGDGSVAPQRFRGLDAARALACAWVVLFHAGGQGPLAERGHGSFVHALASVGYLGVDAFIVLSGVVVARSATPWPGLVRFLDARFRRLFPLYALVVLALAAGAYVRGTHHGLLAAYPNGLDLLAHLTFTHVFFASTLYSFLPPAWSLGLEWWLYVSYAALQRLGKHLAPATFAISAVTLVTLRALGHEADEPGVVVLARLWQFGCGAALAPHLGRWKPSPSLFAGVVAVLGAISWYDNVVDPWMFRVSRLTEPVLWVTVFGALAAIDARHFEKGFGKWIAKRGDASYAVYLTHDPLLRAMHGAPLFEAHRFVVGLGGAYLLGELVHVALEKPLGRALRRRG
jgi:peptidoglycan/LPS O-acetylase OafA/YrhL